MLNAKCRIVVFPSEMIEKSPQSGHTHATHCILHAALFVCLMADKPKFVFLAGVLGRFGSTQLFSMYSLSVLARFGFIERLDAIITCMWLLCAAIKIAITLFLCESLFESMLGKKKKAVYVVVSAALILLGTIPLVSNIAELTWLIRSPVAFVFYFSSVWVIPVTVMICEKIKGRAKSEKV